MCCSNNADGRLEYQTDTTYQKNLFDIVIPVGPKDKNIISKQIKFTQKMTATTNTGEYIKKLDMDDFNFRVSYQTEQDYNVHSNIAKNIISKWSESKKMGV